MKLEDIEWWHRIKLPDGTYTPGKCFHGPDGGDWLTTRFGMPEDLTGKTVLDIGCYDGFFSFASERRGARRVISYDKSQSDGFAFAHDLLKSKIWFCYINLEHEVLTSEADIVLCYGVMYHLKSPLKLIYELFNATEEMCLLETAISTNDSAPMLEYRPGFDNDPTNYFYPNKAFIELASKQVGFKSCEEIYNDGIRATFRLLK